MKKKIVTILMTAAIGTSLLAGQAVMAADTETATEAKADDTGDSKETEEEKTIGKKPETDKDAEGVFSLKFKNLTGKVITEVTVKNEKDEKYPDNFLEKDDKFAADEERTLWFDPNADTEDAAETADDKDTEEASETSEPEVQKYDMQITFEDGTTVDEWVSGTTPHEVQHFIHFRLAIQRKRNFILKEKLLILYLTARI